MFTWLIELFLSSIPAWLWLAGAGTGLGVYFLSGILSHFPPITAYAKLLKPIGGIAALVCVFMYGGSGVQAIWEAKAEAAQAEADKRTAESKEANKQLEEERKKKQSERIIYRDKIKTEIQQVKVLIDKDCRIDASVPEILNKAATNPTGAGK